MDFNKMTQKTQEALHQAQSTALRYGHQEVDGEHLLLALLEQADGLVPRLFNKMDVPVENLKTEVEAELQKRPSISGPGTEAGKIYVTQRLNRVLIKAEEGFGSRAHL
jgi:ATP-dependent Clp protease ATP-binding subunit ClpB